MKILFYGYILRNVYFIDFQINFPLSLRNWRMACFTHLTAIKMHLIKMLGSALKDSFEHKQKSLV